MEINILNLLFLNKLSTSGFIRVIAINASTVYATLSNYRDKPFKGFAIKNGINFDYQGDYLC